MGGYRVGAATVALERDRLGGRFTAAHIKDVVAKREAATGELQAVDANLEVLLSEIRGHLAESSDSDSPQDGPTETLSKVEGAVESAKMAVADATANVSTMATADDKVREAAEEMLTEALATLKTTDGSGPGQLRTVSVDALTKWIQTEALAVYMFGLSLGGAVPGGIVFGCSAALALVMPLVGGYSNSTDIAGDRVCLLWAKGAMGTVAFALWSLLVPGGWLQGFSPFGMNSTTILFIATGLAVAATFVLEGISRRLDRKHVSDPKGK